MWYLPHSQVHNETDCSYNYGQMHYACIKWPYFHSAFKSDVTIVFLDLDFLGMREFQQFGHK